MCVLNTHEDAGDDSFLKGLFKVEFEVFELLADESDGKNGDFFDSEVFTADIMGYLLGDPGPLVAGHFDAADGCNDLNNKVDTLAAALLIIFSRSIIVLSTISLKAARVGGLSKYQM